MADRPAPLRILVRRDGALGDVIHIIPIVKRLRAENPDAIIHVASQYPHLFDGNPDVNRAFRPSDIGSGYKFIFDLNMSFEKDRGRIHIIEAYMRDVFGDTDGDKEYWIKHGTPSRDLPADRSKLIGLHPSTTWSCRTWKKEWWQAIVDDLNEQGFTVVALGTGRDHALARCIDTRDKMPLHDQLATIEACSAFVCSESGLMIVAGASTTPVVSVFNITRSEYVVPWRRGELGKGYFVMTPDIECYGCAAKHQNVTSMSCDRQDEICLTMVDPKEVATMAVVAREHGHV